MLEENTENSDIEKYILETLESSKQMTRSGVGLGLRSKHEIYNKLPTYYSYTELLDALNKLEEDGYVISEVMQIRKYAITDQGREYLDI